MQHGGRSDPLPHDDPHKQRFNFRSETFHYGFLLKDLESMVDLIEHDIGPTREEVQPFRHSPIFANVTQATPLFKAIFGHAKQHIEDIELSLGYSPLEAWTADERLATAIERIETLVESEVNFNALLEPKNLELQRAEVAVSAIKSQATLGLVPDTDVLARRMAYAVQQLNDAKSAYTYAKAHGTITLANARVRFRRGWPETTDLLEYEMTKENAVRAMASMYIDRRVELQASVLAFKTTLLASVQCELNTMDLLAAAHRYSNWFDASTYETTIDVAMEVQVLTPGPFFGRTGFVEGYGAECTIQVLLQDDSLGVPMFSRLMVDKCDTVPRFTFGDNVVVECGHYTGSGGTVIAVDLCSRKVTIFLAFHDMVPISDDIANGLKKGMTAVLSHVGTDRIDVVSLEFSPVPTKRH
jgi:hypothetical protein